MNITLLTFVLQLQIQFLFITITRYAMYGYSTGMNQINLTNTEELFKNNIDYVLMNYYLKPFHNYSKLTEGLKISNPFIDDKQKTPSFNLFKHKSGKWKYKDFATNDIGDVIDLVRKLFKLNFNDAKTKITEDITSINSNAIENVPAQIEKRISPTNYTVKYIFPSLSFVVFISN